MKRVNRVATGSMALFLLMLCLPVQAGADTAAVPTVPALSFREVKVTGDEFIVVRANQAIADLSAYWIGYSSTDTATNIVPTQQLPAISLNAGQAVLFTSDAAQTCDAVYTAKLSASLSDTKGVLQLRQLVNIDKNTSTFTTIDSVNWIKPGTTDKSVITDNLDLRKETGISMPVWYHDATNVSTQWAVGNFANCSLSVAQTQATGTATPQVYTWPTTSDQPPAIILSLASESTGTSTITESATIPASDIGLAPPQITELLPNPIGTGNDATDEFIELYNPNPKPFDLSGFVLQTGLTTKHSYTFPAATSLPPGGFVAFYSADTGLSLSNTAGESDLLDPLGSLLSQTDAYGTAKDGQSWSLAKGSWYWTTQPSPGKSNTISEPTSSASSKSSKSSTAKKSTAGSVKGTKTSNVSASLPIKSVPADAANVTPVHPATLAVVAALAVAYGLYEYRLDMANLFHRLKRHRALSRVAG